MKTAEDAERRLDVVRKWWAAGVPKWEIEIRLDAMDCREEWYNRQREGDDE